jgi:hypothetical protein
MSSRATTGTTIAIIVVMTIAAMVGRNGVMAMRVAARTGADAGERGVARSTRRIARFSGLYFIPVMADFIPDQVASISCCAVSFPLRSLVGATAFVVRRMLAVSKASSSYFKTLLFHPPSGCPEDPAGY